ncbi:MAG TPA: haloacid dehalogenase-like hydrolase [Stellaceae bacterium]|jgi:hypothetical protein|nr:haloacid dehalogenase-like hydrolase [Stellaceae bacterium]
MAEARLTGRHAVEAGSPLPLVVDLDGTLVRTDTTLEGVLSLARHPVSLLRALPALRLGRAAFKARLAASADLDAALLPYHLPLLDYLREARAAGRPLLLATGADRRTAEAVARYLGLFGTVLASDGRTNLTGAAKLAAIRDTLGGRDFAYAGNSAADLRVWCGASAAICVNARAGVVRAAATATTIERAFPPAPPLRLLLRAMRPLHWSRNLLVFLPVAVAQATGGAPAWGAAWLIFAAFCCAASGTAIAGELTNLAADRRHPDHSHGAFANGTLALHIGVVAAVILVFCGLALGSAAGTLAVLICYAAGSVAYSLWLKAWSLPRLIAPAARYGLRLLAGAVIAVG